MSHLQSLFVSVSLDSPHRFSFSSPLDLSLVDTIYRMHSKEQLQRLRRDLCFIQNQMDSAYLRFCSSQGLMDSIHLGDQQDYYVWLKDFRHSKMLQMLVLQQISPAIQSVVPVNSSHHFYHLIYQLEQAENCCCFYFSAFNCPVP